MITFTFCQTKVSHLGVSKKTEVEFNIFEGIFFYFKDLIRRKGNGEKVFPSLGTVWQVSGASFEIYRLSHGVT